MGGLLGILAAFIVAFVIIGFAHLAAFNALKMIAATDSKPAKKAAE